MDDFPQAHQRKKLLDATREDILSKVRYYLRIEENKKIVSECDESVSFTGSDYPILDSLSIKLGLSLRNMLAPPSLNCLLCKKLLQRKNPPSQAILHTQSGPEICTKISYECRDCASIFSFRGKFESNTRLYYSVDHWGNPNVGYKPRIGKDLYAMDLSHGS